MGNRLAGSSGCHVLGQVGEPDGEQHGQDSVGAVYAHKPQHLCNKDEDDEAGEAASNASERGLKQRVHAVDHVAIGGEAKGEAKRTEHDGNEEARDDGRESLAHAFGHTGGHLDGEPALDDGNVNLGGDEGGKEGHEGAAATKVVDVDERVTSVVSGKGNHDEVRHEGEEHVLEAKLLMTEALCCATCNACHHEEGHKAHGRVVDGSEDSAQTGARKKRLISLNRQSVEQVEDGSHKDDGHKAHGASANGLDVLVLGNRG